MQPVNIHQAKTDLSRLVERAEHGEEIVIARAGKPVAKLVPFNGVDVRDDHLRPREPGSMAGLIVIHDDFDDPLPDDLLDAFEGK